MTRGYMRFISLCVLFCFTGTLGAPFVEAQTTGTAAKMTEVAKSGLGDLWFGWTDMIKKAAQPTMDQAAAINWFQSRGATPRQAELLALNAAAEGQLVKSLPTATTPPAEAPVTAAQAQGNIFTRFFNKVTGKSTAAATETAAPAAQSGSFLTRVKDAFSTTSTNPVPGSFLKATPVVQNGVTVNPAEAKLTPQDVAAGFTSAAQKAKAMVGMETAPVPAEAKPGFLTRFKDAVVNGAKTVGTKVKEVGQKVALTGKRAASDTAGAVRTGAWSAADRLTFWQSYYKIPVTDNLGIKIRGELNYTTKFTDGGWVVDKYSTSTAMPGKGEASNALFSQMDSMAAAAAPSKMGFFQNIASKITGGWTKVKNAISGHKELTTEAKNELGKIQIENQLLEKARTLNEVSSSIEQRISNLEQTAKALRRDVPADEIKALRDTQNYVNEQKKVLEQKLNEVHDGKAVTVVKDAAKWALYSVGITAGVNIAKQVFSGQGVDLKAAFSFMGQPAFWAGTAGGFVGSMAGSYLGNMLLGGIVSGLPPGIGLFFRILPGFLGAAVGFEFGGSLFGQPMDLAGAIVQTLASAVGYAGTSMLWTALMGTAAPGIVLVAASIAAGMLASFLMNKLRGDPEMEAMVPTDNQPIVPPQASDTQAATPPPAATNPQGALSLAELQQKRSEAYTNYINLLKQRKIPEARDARDQYEQYDSALKAQISASGN